MKKIKLLVIASILTGVFSNITFSQSEDAKSALVKLFELSKTKSYEKAASLIAYEGDDKNRNLLVSFDAANKEEIAQVKRICKKISALIELSSKYEFGNSSNKKDGEKEIYITEVTFISGAQKLVSEFSFIKTEKGFLLINMN